MTTFANVAAALLVIALAATPAAAAPTVDPPRTAAESSSQVQQPVVSIDAAGRIYLSTHAGRRVRVALAALASALPHIKPPYDAHATLRASRQVPYGRFLAVADQLADCCYASLDLIGEPAPAPFGAVTIQIIGRAPEGAPTQATAPIPVMINAKPATYISVGKDGRMSVSFATGPNSTEMRPATLDNMAGLIAQSLAVPDPTSQRLYIRTERDATFGAFMAVMNRLRIDGYDKIGLIFEASAADEALMAPKPPVFVSPDWVSRPTAAELTNYYPERAARNGVAGRVAMKCTVTAVGSLEKCEILSETPPDFGFGEAALRLAPLFQMKPMTRDGVPVGGAAVSIPISFAFPAPKAADNKP